MVLSNETPVGLKNGAKTGLSVLVSALCFLVLCFVGPLFANIPHAGTMPLLFTIGVFLVANARKIEWNVMSDALPAFFIIFIIPFSQNLLRGSMFGFIVYAMMAVCCGHMRGYIEEYLHAVKEEMLALFGIEKKGDDIDNGKGGVDASDMHLPADLMVADVQHH
jgi:xanthine/uracil/vitamin C permease (AzgA family)